MARVVNGYSTNYRWLRYARSRCGHSCLVMSLQSQFMPKKTADLDTVTMVTER